MSQSAPERTPTPAENAPVTSAQEDLTSLAPASNLAAAFAAAARSQAQASKSTQEAKVKEAKEEQNALSDLKGKIELTARHKGLESKIKKVSGKRIDLVLDEEAKRKNERSRQRKETLVSNVLSMKGSHALQFSLVEEGMTLVNIKSANQERDFDAEEDEAEFVAGNVIPLAHLSTGTDNGSATSVRASGDTASANKQSADNDESVEVEMHDGKVVDPMPIKAAILHVSSTLNLPNVSPERRTSIALLPALLADINRHWFTYGLALILCALCIFKVYQVQETNNITARLNDVSLLKNELEAEKNNLLAQHQNLSEHTTVRESALNRLNMVVLHTDQENLLYLNH